jgi:hypothetical protein
MNRFVADSFAENIQRLALGIEPIDAQRRLRIAHPVQVTFDSAPQGLPRSVIERHDSCLHVLRYFRLADDLVEMSIYDAGRRGPARQVGFPILPAGSVDLRFSDGARRYVPRRLSFPLLTAAAADAPPFTPGRRIRRPSLFPGAAYDTSETSTGLRARVLRGGRPMRWARVEARLPGNNVLVGRAHGDDRGEFLLLLGANASPLSDLENPLSVTVTVFGPNVVPAPASPDLPGLDPLWDLPLEIASAPGTPDPVSAGETLPAGYVSTPTSTRDVEFILGNLRSSGIADFIFS